MNKLSSKHYLFFICTVSFIGLRSYSSIFISMGGADTWLAGLIAGVIYLAYLYFIIYVCKKTNNFDIKDIFKKTYPKWLSSILIFIFALALFLTSIESAAAQSDSIHSNIFIETPIWYSLLFFIIPAAYLITRRLETLVIVILVTIVLVFSTMFLVELFTFHYQHYSYLLPIMALGVNKEFILCILLILGAFSSTAVTFPFLKYVEKKEKLGKFTIIGGLIIVFISIASVVSAVTTFGPLRSSNIYYPEFLRVQRIQIQGFIEFGDLLFISKTTCLWFLKYVICAVAILYLYKDKFTNKKVYALIYSIVAYICAFIISRNHYLLFDYLRYYQLIALVLLGVIPFITFSIYYFKFKKNLKTQAAGNGNNTGPNKNISNNNTQNTTTQNNNPSNTDTLIDQNSLNTQDNSNTQGYLKNRKISNTQDNSINQNGSNNQGGSYNEGGLNNPNNQYSSNTQGVLNNQNNFSNNIGTNFPNSFGNKNYYNSNNDTINSIINNRSNNPINSISGNDFNAQNNLNNTNSSNNQNANNPNETNNSNTQDEANGSYVFGNYNDSQSNNQSNNQNINGNNSTNSYNQMNTNNGNMDSSTKGNPTDNTDSFAQSNISGNFFFPSSSKPKE